MKKSEKCWGHTRGENDLWIHKCVWMSCPHRALVCVCLHPWCRWYTWMSEKIKSNWVMVQRSHMKSAWLPQVKCMYNIHINMHRGVKSIADCPININVCVLGGVPRNLQVIERAGEEVMKRTTLFRKVCLTGHFWVYGQAELNCSVQMRSSIDMLKSTWN